MSTDAGVMDLVDVSELVDIPINCEHSQHRTDPKRHTGLAEWIQFDAPCGCPTPDVVGSAFVCNLWRQWVGAHARSGGFLICLDCRTAFPAELMIYTKI